MLYNALSHMSSEHNPSHATPYHFLLVVQESSILIIEHTYSNHTSEQNLLLTKTLQTLK